MIIRAVKSLTADSGWSVNPHPRVIQFELTNQCPMSCKMCPRTELMKRSIGHMDFVNYAAALRDYAQSTPKRDSFCLHGWGESLLHPQIEEAILLANGHGFRPTLSVNPIVLTAEKIEMLLRVKLDVLILSMDGFGNESFEKIRGLSNAWEKSRINVLKFLDRKKELGVAIDVNLQVIDVPGFESESRAAVKYWSKVPGLIVSLKPCIDLCHTGSVRKSGPITCRAPFSGQLQILRDGTATVCCNDFDGVLPMGNVRSQSLSEIWNGNPIQRLRAEFSSGNVTNELCSKCQFLRN